jgi:hypothetical protein
MYLPGFSFHFILLTFLLSGKITFSAPPQVLIPEMIKQDTNSISTVKNTTPIITYKLIPGIKGTWGYDILVDNRMKIHQPSIPGLPGLEGFKTKEKAEKVAKLVTKKMKNGEMPPTITTEELKKLKAI